jgi:polyisoprenoid-binding protein YceI
MTWTTNTMPNMRSLILLFVAAGALMGAAEPLRDGRAAGPAAPIQLVVAPTGNQVRYRVREQLAGFDFPNDAVGKSAAITGALSLDESGRVIPDESKFTVAAATFTSDRDRRDNYVRGRLLEADQHQSIVLVPTEVRGLTLPLPSSGAGDLELRANLTVRGVTRPTLWRVSARFHDGRVSGTALTSFTFEDFQMEKPRVRSVLSVADTITLEYDFNLLARPVSSS